MKRLGYRKSRKGCIRCKQRRVKCDENAPCSACIRHEVPCSLEPPLAASTELPRRSHPRTLAREEQIYLTTSPSQPGNGHPSSSPTAGLFSYFSHVQYGSPGHSDSQDWILDIELMHHYTAEGHRTLHTPCHHDTEVLQNDIPHEGLSQPFLLHQILAFSALHLSYLSPERRHKYLIQASKHQGVAISTMNSMLAKPWDPEACHALYGTSIFLAISAFGTLPSCDRYNTFQAIDSLVDIFVLARGMNTILRSSEEDIRKGPLGKLMAGCDCEPATPSSYLAELMPQLKELLTQLDEQTPDVSEDKRTTLTETLGSLVETIQIAGSNKRARSFLEQRVIFGWPMRVPSTFLSLLRNKDPLAMVVISHYCVLLKSGETKCWYFEGWASVLMKPIVASVAGTPWEELIKWSTETIESMASKTTESRNQYNRRYRQDLA